MNYLKKKKNGVINMTYINESVLEMVQENKANLTSHDSVEDTKMIQIFLKEYNTKYPHPIHGIFSENTRFGFFSGIRPKSTLDTVWDISENRKLKNENNIKILNEINDKIGKLLINFEDLRIRQLYYSDLKDYLIELEKIGNYGETSSELLKLINQFAKYNYSENLNSNQIEALKKAINKLKSKNIDEKELENLFDELTLSGLDLFPSITGISDLYED